MAYGNQPDETTHDGDLEFNSDDARGHTAENATVNARDTTTDSTTDDTKEGLKDSAKALIQAHPVIATAAAVVVGVGLASLWSRSPSRTRSAPAVPQRDTPPPQSDDEPYGPAAAAPAPRFDSGAAPSSGILDVIRAHPELALASLAALGGFIARNLATQATRQSASEPRASEPSASGLKASEQTANESPQPTGRVTPDPIADLADSDEFATAPSTVAPSLVS